MCACVCVCVNSYSIESCSGGGCVLFLIMLRVEINQLNRISWGSSGMQNIEEDSGGSQEAQHRAFKYFIWKYEVFFNNNSSTSIELVRYTRMCSYDFAHGWIVRCIIRVGEIQPFVEYLLRDRKTWEDDWKMNIKDELWGKGEAAHMSACLFIWRQKVKNWLAFGPSMLGSLED